MADSRIRVLIAEDDTPFRKTLGDLLRLDREFDVVGEVPNGELALAQTYIVNPSVILTDIDMPRVNGIDLTRQIREKFPSIAIVILTKFGDDDHVFRAIKAGAIGYLLKDAGLEEIRAAVRSAAAGDGALAPSLVTRVLSEFNRVHKAASQTRQLFAELSRREVEVLELLATGAKNAAIAEKLFLSEKTVKAHVGSILRKLHVNDRTEAALLAQKNGLTL